MKRYYFYVLYTADGYFYGGFTDDVQRRLKTHESRKGAKFTRVKSRHPLQLIYEESFDTKHDALRAEAAFKKLTRKQKEFFLIAHNINPSIWQ
ncbi:GIY-YIG nuclease family protein [Leuconostoc rapi]|uniref:GIY-YIG nuclease family protein n=1 Tax=Leuconostoc rapi TaxID=1406906 RepID=UPI00195C558D|nr:GIY-YIG nuclease family protein [Leuconostoc rapi]MBM7434986.1 putative endonuclease [Leuconostoc rapi]